MEKQQELTIDWDPEPITIEQFEAYVPEKLELIDGKIPGGLNLFVLLLRQVGAKDALRILATLITHR